MRLILVELNEINFDFVKKYIDSGEHLPGFQKIIGNLNTTSSEKDYKNLEPWIQWASLHLGKKFEEHGIFRLGDITKSSDQQIFEKIEQAGYKVGAVSPMNTKNELNKPAYFIPDPWTQTKSDGSFLNKGLSEAISQAVNDNSSSKITFRSLIFLFFGFLRHVNFFKKIKLTLFAFSALKKPWRKALFLDMFLHEIHMSLFKKNKPDFSTVFFNAGAHIQHHYFFNSKFFDDSIHRNPNWYINNKIDPFKEMIICYDKILQELLNIDNTEIIVATGLSQAPYKKVKFYYRLVNHKNFLSKCNIEFKDVFPRMTRDFLLTFKNEKLANIAQKKLEAIKVNNDERLFGLIDNRGSELFITLTYPNEIKDSTYVSIGKRKINLKEQTVFVAIKNGMHSEKGYTYFSENIRKFSPQENSHVANIHKSIIEIFR